MKDLYKIKQNTVRNCLTDDTAPHDIEVSIMKCEGNPMDSAWFGYCKVCGASWEIPAWQIEEAFY